MWYSIYTKKNPRYILSSNLYRNQKTPLDFTDEYIRSLNHPDTILILNYFKNFVNKLSTWSCIFLANSQPNISRLSNVWEVILDIALSEW